MEQDRTLLAKAITVDLFGEDALLEPAEVSAPDKYALGELLGRGGFGVVYRAHDTVLDRPVALKFLTDARPADVARFRREARCAARLQDPSIVKVYELGEHEGQFHIAMQLVDGPNLAEAELDRAGQVQAVRDVARALGHAHREGIVHRDIKPANILIDGAQRTYLTDFGVARDLHATAGSLSGEGLVIGTPGLMAPEQARGESRAVDGRSDIYSLGATLYLLLTGRAPFQRANLVETLHAVIHAEPVWPRSIDPTIPRGLESIMLRCLRKAPGDRYPHMDELCGALEAHLSGERLPGEEAVWFRQLVGAPAPAPSTPEPSRDAAIGLEAAQELATWDAQALRTSRDVPRLFPQLEALEARLSETLATDPDYPWTRFYRGAARVRLGRIDAALEDMERSIDRLGEVAGAWLELGRLYLQLGLIEQDHAHVHLSYTGSEIHLDQTREYLKQAQVAFEEARRLRKGIAPWQVELAGAVARLAERDYVGCAEACAKILERDPDAEEVWKLQGDAQRLAGLDPTASFEEAIGIRRGYLDALLALAEVHLERGDAAPAQRALERAEQVHPGLPRVSALLAQALVAQAEATLDPALLDRAAALLCDARAHAPDDYRLALRAAEVDLARGAANPSATERALETLAQAMHLRGCQNRVELTACRARLQRAEHAIAAGDVDVALAEVDAVLGERDGEQTRTPDNDPWLAVFADAEAVRARAVEADGG